MSDKLGVLVAAAITLPPTLLLTWLAIRILIARVRDLRDAVEQERQRK